MSKQGEMSAKDASNRMPSFSITSVNWVLAIYDLIVFVTMSLLVTLIYDGNASLYSLYSRFALLLVLTFAFRFIFKVYCQILRYGDMQSYTRLSVADVCAFAVYALSEVAIFGKQYAFVLILAFHAIDLILIAEMRAAYRYAYKNCGRSTWWGNFLNFLLKIFAHRDKNDANAYNAGKIGIAIIGAGRVGAGLASELIGNSAATYTPCCFIDVDKTKIGRQISGIPVIAEEFANADILNAYRVQEIVFAVPQLAAARKKELYDHYVQFGRPIKNYDYPSVGASGNGRRRINNLEIEDLLFRKPITVADSATDSYYFGKTVLITGGGGSIGSELCRQIARMSPERIVIVDCYENGAYDVQQELRIKYGKSVKIDVEVFSVTNKQALEKIFAEYRPQVVLHAAAHKHVPLMERNCCEAIINNVFGTLNTVVTAEKFKAERFIMVSTDKAVNPTNVMGATKRMCEMIVQSHSAMNTDTVFSSTRFGNVLGSAGSVVPLFKKQIENGGPVTLTDKRITRYFMTIPEASQLVLQAGAMAKNGELFVLDMGEPIKILDLAENMIRLSGFAPYTDIDIVEVGLRPGEKLYEELLVKTEKLGKTKNSLIFTEQDKPITSEELKEKLDLLKKAAESGDNAKAKSALRETVETYKTPEEINAAAIVETRIELQTAMS